MSQISQKSISGITSITTPAGIDDQLTLHTSDTSQAAKLDGAGNFHFSNHVNTTGISSASNFKTGSSNLHSSGLSAASIDVGNNIKLGNAGVVTATSFIGDGSDLTNLPAGLGTALSATASSPLNKMYYTNQVLGVPSSVTVDVPSSASKAYTQYADIKVDGSADLIIAEGDDLIPDVLGLADFGTFGGGASAGRIRVNSISNAANDGSPTVQKGLVITGVCTATSFSGSGANLTSLPAQATIANNADNRVITGGSGVNLNGESTLTYDGTNLDLGDGKYVRLGASNDFQMWHNGGTGNTNIKQVTGDMYFYTGSDLNMHIRDGTSVDLYYANAKKFETTSTGATLTGDLYATSRLLVNTTSAGESNGDEATFANTGGNAGITIRSAVNAETKIYFSEGTSGGSQYRGTINYNHNTNYMAFSTNENERVRIDSSGNLKFNSGYGSVNTAYGIRAWIAFKAAGNANVTRGSGNATMTDHGTGDFTMNFTTAMPDTGYSMVGTAGYNSGVIVLGLTGGGTSSSPTTTGFRFTVRANYNNSSLMDEEYINLMVVR